MSREEITISEMARSKIESHALQCAPNECCGLLGGRGDKIASTYPLANVAEKPCTRYFAAPEALFKAMRQIREAGEEMLGIYHSHPRSPAFPSRVDVEMAFYPDAIYFIISLLNPMELRAFTIEDEVFNEIEISIINNL
ncbi:MAG: M67 family metallopeptidase [Acidobacteriota bacterium]